MGKPITNTTYLKLLGIETRDGVAADLKRLASHERQLLQVALQSGEPSRIAKAIASGDQLLELWKEYY